MKKIETNKVFHVILIFFCMTIVLFLYQDAEAKIFKVNSTADIVDAAPGNGICATGAATCTLRAAVQEANAFPGADTIILKVKTYRRTIAGTGEDLAATGDLDITDSVTITGLGAAYTIIDGNLIDRVFHVIGNATVASFVGLKIQNGFVSSGVPAGAGILNFRATTAVIACTIKNNISYASRGGGIFNDGGGLKVVSSRVTQNVLYYEGGPVYGGGIASLQGELKLMGTKISDNLASNIADTASPFDAARGGGVAISGGTSVKIKSCTITGNIADSWTGDQYASEGGGLHIEEVSNANIINTKIAYNTATGIGGFGGGVKVLESNATFSGCTIIENSATGVFGGLGGGLYLENGSADPMTITINNLSSITYNFATTYGGGIYTLGSIIVDASADSVVAKNSPEDYYP